MTNVFDSFEAMNSTIADIRQRVVDADYQPILEAFQTEIAAGEAAAFAAESTPGGEAWPALAPSTEKRKGNSTILVETGSLMASLINVGGSGNIAKTNQRELVFGTDVEYSAFLETGTTKMPRRQHVGMSDETLKCLVDKIADATVAS